MPRLIDVKPKVGLMVDVKPQVGGMTDIKPKVGELHAVQGRVYEVILGARQLMLTVPFLTYPVAITVVQDHD